MSEHKFNPELNDNNDNPLASLMSILNGGKGPREKEQICFLDKDDIEDWNDIESTMKRLSRDRKVLQSRYNKFWATIELKYDVSDRTNLEIDRTTTALMADKEAV
jgi:hypothetical protein